MLRRVAVLLCAMALMVPAMTGAAFAADEAKKNVVNDWMKEFEDETSLAVTGWNLGCFSDLPSNMADVVKNRICDAKKMGMISGGTFAPYSTPSRKTVAQWYRDGQIGLNAASVSNGQLYDLPPNGYCFSHPTASTSQTGWGHNAYGDVTTSNVTDAQDRGIGFVHHWAGGLGKLGSSSFSPHQNISEAESGQGHQFWGGNIDC